MVSHEGGGVARAASASAGQNASLPPGLGARRGGLAALLFTSLSLATYGGSVLLHLGTRCVGTCTSDPKLYLWALNWTPYALSHHLSVFSTDLLWLPSRLNLAWVTTLPGPGLLMAPITDHFGPLVSENLLMLAAPSLAAWAAYLACGRVTRRFWPSIGGGLLFGWCTYLEQHMRGQLNLVLIFCAPLAVYLVIRHFEGSIGKGAFVVWLSAVLAGQLSISTEPFATMTLFGGIALLCLLIAGPSERRRQVLGTIGLIAAAYCLAALLASPLLISALANVPVRTLRPAAKNSVDLLSFFVPRRTMAVGGSVFGSLTDRFSSIRYDDGAYIGPAAVLLLALFAWNERKARSTWLVLGFIGAVAVLALGPSLHIAGHPTIPMPEALITRAPLLGEVLPNRFPEYLSLAVAFVGAIWLARGSGWGRWWRWALVIGMLVTVIPLRPSGTFHTTMQEPSFFTEGTWAKYLTPGEAVLSIPAQAGDELVWQVDAHMGFALVRAYVGPSHPSGPGYLPPLVSEAGQALPDPALYAESLSVHHVGAVIVAAPVPLVLSAFLLSVTRVVPTTIGGVAVYRLPGASPLPRRSG